MLWPTDSTKNSRSTSLDGTSLLCEPLEDRRMLATFDVFAAGATGEETMEVRLFDQVLATFENVGGDFNNGVFEKYSFEVDFEGGELGDVDDLFIAFTNDLYIPGEVDRNLRVDAIVLSEFEGETGELVRYETEAPGVYSTGTWRAEDGVTRGYRQSEVLHSNGFFNYSRVQEGSTRIQIEAKGNEGGEQFDLQIDGQTVESFTVTQNSGFYVWTGPVDQRIDHDQVRIVFTNDEYDPENGIDKNLIIEDVEVGRFVYRDFAIRPERSSTVFSTGTWRPEDGIQPGIRFSDTLHTNGYFQFGVFDQPIPSVFNAFPSEFDDRKSEDSGSFGLFISRTGSTEGEVTLDYATRTGTADASDFVPVSGTAVFADGVRVVEITIPIIDDSAVEDTESFEVVVSNPTGGALLNTFEPITFEILDNDTSTPRVIYEETFDNGNGGWTFEPFGTDTAERGQWEIGRADETTLGTDPFQLGEGFAGNQSLVTGLSGGSGIGSNDVDGGVTSALSPEIDLPSNADAQVRLAYNFAHTRSATFSDQLRVGVLVDGELVNILTSGGNEGATRTGEWREVAIFLGDFAGQTIQFLIEAEDETNTVVEAAIGQLVVETV